jgi:hypothetical protein
MEYFSIYPFTQDREDFRLARICEMLNIGAQGKAFRDKTLSFFMPDYLTDRYVNEEQAQIAAELAFAAKIEALYDN